MVTDISTLLNAIILIIVLLALIFAIRQTELVRRTLYGEIYKRPPLKRVGFLKPEVKHDNRISFNKMVEGDSFIFEEVVLPKNSKVSLSVTWRTKEKQSLRHVQLGFKPRGNKKPRIVKRLGGWVAKEIKPLQSGEYIDLDGYYHIEYQIPRKFGKESPFIVEFEVETGDSGNYDFRIEVYSEEAKESFEKTLKVIVE